MAFRSFGRFFIARSVAPVVPKEIITIQKCLLLLGVRAAGDGLLEILAALTELLLPGIGLLANDAVSTDLRLQVITVDAARLVGIELLSALVVQFGGIVAELLLLACRDAARR